MDIISTQNFRMETHFSDLLDYLCQVVISRTDEIIQQENTEFIETKTNIAASESLMKTYKSDVERLKLGLAKEKKLKEVLSLIGTLEESGSFTVGQSRTKVLKILEEIDEKDYETLKNLEQKLSLYRPE